MSTLRENSCQPNRRRADSVTYSPEFGCRWLAVWLIFFQRMSRANNDLLSVLPLQVSLYFGGYYSAAFFIVTLLIFIYKGKRRSPWKKRINIVYSVLVLVYVLHDRIRLYLNLAASSMCCFVAANNIGVMLPYPTSSIGVEVLMVLLYPFLSFSRLYLCE